MNEIHEFFAVTQTSVYVVKDKIENGCPIVEKIAANRESCIPVGGRLRNGSCVGIMLKTGIILYNPSKKSREPESVNISHWGGHTSPIIALFLEKEKAINCLNSENTITCDLKWKKETIETLEKIGNNHPVFVPSVLEEPSQCY